MDKKALILEKSPNEGLLELRQEIRLYLARNKGIHADVEQIIIGSGAEYLYNLIIALLGRNRIYGIEKPSYKKIEQVYRSSGVEICMLPLSKDGIDTSSLLSSKTDILHTTPYRSYPTGVTATASKRHEYIRWASVGRRYIVEDDFESEFSVSSKPEETLFSLSENDNVVYMNTFSKTVSPALRVGYMVLPKHLVEDFKNKLGFLSCTVPTFEQLLLTELISSGDFERHINRVRRKKRKEI
jgi:GntR family transcriptional regulator/MocR family aminotransferase